MRRRVSGRICFCSEASSLRAKRTDCLESPSFRATCCCVTAINYFLVQVNLLSRESIKGGNQMQALLCLLKRKSKTDVGDERLHRLHTHPRDAAHFYPDR